MISAFKAMTNILVPHFRGDQTCPIMPAGRLQQMTVYVRWGAFACAAMKFHATRRLVLPILMHVGVELDSTFLAVNFP